MIECRGEHDELLASPASHAVVRANGTEQARGDLAQHGIADLVAVGVVDRLEVVDVDQSEARRERLAARTLELGLEHLREVAAVEQPGERVRARGFTQSLLGCHLGRRVSHDSLDDQALTEASRHAAAHDPARHAVEPDHAAAHLAHLTAQVARGVLGVERAVVGVHGLDPGAAPVAVVGHATEQSLTARAREQRLAPAARQDLVDVDVVVDRLDDAREGVRALTRLIQLALELLDSQAAGLEIVHHTPIGTSPGDMKVDRRRSQPRSAPDVARA